MRRSLAVSALALSVIGLTAVPASATPPPPEETDDGFTPVDPAYYDQVAEADACGDRITITSGDVREFEERVTVLATGETLTEYRGAFTLDLVRQSDGAVIDELDIGGPAWELVSEVGDEVRITNTLYGASLLWVFADSPVDVEAFEEAGVPSLAYFTDPEQSVELEITLDIETGETLEVEFDEIDAELVDLCGEFQHQE